MTPLFNRELKIFFIVGFFLFINTTLCSALPPIAYVSGNGSGDFNCDGTDDHVQINQALKLVAENSSYTTVHLKGPFTYNINDTLLIGNNTTLEGDSRAEVKLVNNASWETSKPIIMERSLNSKNISIHGFTLNGNREGNTNVDSGKGYYNLIHLSKCQNITVYNMLLTNNHGDGLKTDSCSNISLYNNKIYLLGHDGLYASKCLNIKAYNNTITCRTNSALRLYNSNNASFYDNTITSQGSGGSGIEIQKYGTPDMNDINVYNNTIYKTNLAGVWIFSSGSTYPSSSANVYIHHNQIYDTGTKTSNNIIGGIVSSGFNALVENNVLNRCYGSAISQKETYSAVPGSGYIITARNNIITNSRPSSAGGNAYGMYNLLTATHAFLLQSNCFYNNGGGDYAGVQVSPSDIRADPQYTNESKNDYHMKSKAGRWNGSGWVNDNISSLCIDAGYIYSDYSLEPEDNGDRINIGAYGNTKYASKSWILNGNNSNSSNTSETPAFPETLISNNKSDQNTPAIYGDNIVWEDNRNGIKSGNYTDIYIYNLSTGSEKQLTLNSSWVSSPVIYRDSVVWDDNRNFSSDIYMYNISTLKETQITFNESCQEDPAIYGDKIVWIDWSNENADIYLYNLSTSKTIQITSNKSDQVKAALFNNRIVWQDSRNGNWDIYMYDASSSKEMQITADKFEQISPAIYEDRVVWQDSRNGNWRIYVYNISSSRTTQITANESNECNPAIYGNKIVWEDSRNSNSDIYMYNLSSGKEIQITANQSWQGSPAIYGDRIVWSDWRNGNTDIYMCKLPDEKPEGKKPFANFSSNTTQGNAPLCVHFTDFSENATSRNWDFENKGIIDSTDKMPVHIYEVPGNYTVNLTAINQYGAASKLGKITVLKKQVSPVPPIANYSTNVTEGNTPLIVKFTDLSKNATSWYWDFGDKSNSTQQNPVHTYSAAGNFTVTLKAINSDGNDTKTKVINVKTAPQKPVASFSASPISGNAPLKVSFNDTSIGSPSSWGWSFGDKNTSTSKNPTHTYSQSGKYTISLTVKNTIGNNTATKSGYINVADPLKAPTANFSASPISGKAPLKINFKDTSAGSPTSWTWNFGDKSTSSSHNPSHTYSKAGKYTISLIAKNSAGSNTKSASNYITVTSK